MTSPTESGDTAALAREYAAALAEYVGGAGEEALSRGYRIGRRLAAGGVGILDAVQMHQAAMQRLIDGRESGPPAVFAMATQFLTETLSPFEMTLRAFQASARLLGLSEALARENAEIERARRQLNTILDATTAVIYLKDADGRYLFVNSRFEAVFGVGRDDVVGKNDAEVLPPELAQTLCEGDRRALAACEPRELEETLPVGGAARTYLSLKFPLLDADGAAYGVCCVATDFTERKLAAENLRRAREAAEAANRELESFSYSVSHDLRAPLRSIEGFSKLLLDDGVETLDRRGRDYLQRVRAAVQRMSELIDDLLQLSRVGQAPLRRAPVDVSALVRVVAAELRAGAPDRKVDVRIEDGLVLHADERLMKIVLENLLGNAWKFTGPTPHARIEFGAYDSSLGRTYFVRDNGAGFDMAQADRLFGAFQRLHGEAEFPGTGIGLATVQRVIRRHGGRVWAESRPGAGATFYFTVTAVGREDVATR